MNRWLTRALPLAVIVALAAAAWILGLNQYLSLEALRENQAMMQDYVQQHPVLSAVAYVGAYAAVVALSLPGATAMSLAGGFLFGFWLGGVQAVIAATIGATLVFMAARGTFGDVLRRRSGAYLRRIEDGFRTDAFNYILFLRLVPIFPFWAVNLSMALLEVRLATYVAATAIGIVPATLVIAAIGAGLSDFVEMGDRAGLTDLFSPTVLAALLGLALLSILPVLIRRWRRSDHDVRP